MSENNKTNEPTPKWVTIVSFVIACAIVFPLIIIPMFSAHSEDEDNGKNTEISSSNTQGQNESSTSDIEDACLTRAVSFVRDDKVSVTTMQGLLDADTNTAGKNKNGDPMTLYRWYGEKDGKKVSFACYAAKNQYGGIDIATITMNLEPIYQNDAYDYAE